MTNKVSSTMYTKAKKIAGWWVIALESNNFPQFRSLSRKIANEWRTLNEPIPASSQLNATAGAAVWRQRNL